MQLGGLVFFAVAVLAVVGAALVAFSTNIVHSAFALLGMLLGVCGLYLLLGADFVAAVQLLIYVGGVVVLALFAVMLTHRVGDPVVSNRAVGRLPALLISGAGAACCLVVFWRVGLQGGQQAELAPTTGAIGDSFLKEYVLPFELASVVLLAVLVGAVVVSRKELK